MTDISYPLLTTSDGDTVLRCAASGCKTTLTYDEESPGDIFIIAHDRGWRQQRKGGVWRCHDCTQIMLMLVDERPCCVCQESGAKRRCRRCSKWAHLGCMASVDGNCRNCGWEEARGA